MESTTPHFIHSGLTSTGQDMSRGADGVAPRDALGRRILPPRGYLTPGTASELKAAVAADPRSVPTIAAEVGIGERFLYSLMAADRRPSRDVAYRRIDVLDLAEAIAAARLLDESSPGVARWPTPST